MGDPELWNSGLHAVEDSQHKLPAPAPRLSPKAGGPAMASAKKILVVDDDRDIREMVARTVSRAGFSADTAQDGEEGWQAICMTPYDLIITDHEMPRLTGLSLIRRLRQLSHEPPCILISGNLPEPESALKGILHSDAYLEKPFSAVALIEKVYGILLYGDSQAS
jgi:two-component system, OmpR family, alkaline phosphatase synthesis response regulator PhoP